MLFFHRNLFLLFRVWIRTGPIPDTASVPNGTHISSSAHSAIQQNLIQTILKDVVHLQGVLHLGYSMLLILSMHMGIPLQTNLLLAPLRHGVRHKSRLYVQIDSLNGL